jgi:hypothetical protein
MRTWITKTLSGWIAADGESQRVLNKFPLGTTIEADVKTRQSRSGPWHRRYWLLMSRLAENVDRIDIRDLHDTDGEPMMYPVHCAEDVHTALKYITGHCHKHVFETPAGRLTHRVPKPTNFDEMTPDEWAAYWPRVLDAVHQRVLPSVGGYAEDDLARLAS